MALHGKTRQGMGTGNREGTMKTLVVFDSQYGNTEHIAGAIAAQMREDGEVRIARVGDVEVIDLDWADLVIVGGPTQKHGLSPAMHFWLSQLPRGILNAKLGLAFDTRYPRARLLTGAASGKIASALERLGCVLLAPGESFFVDDREGPLEEGEPERAASWAQKAASTFALDVSTASTAH
jgi:flavodoxin